MKNLLLYIKNNIDEQKRKAKIASDITRDINRKSITIRNRLTNEILYFTSYKEADSVLNTSVRYLKKLKNSGKIGSKKWEIIDG